MAVVTEDEVDAVEGTTETACELHLRYLLLYLQAVSTPATTQMRLQAKLHLKIMPGIPVGLRRIQ